MSEPEYYPLEKAAKNLKCEAAYLIRLGATGKICIHADAMGWLIEPFKIIGDKAITTLGRRHYTGPVRLLVDDLLRCEGYPSNINIRRVLLPPVDGDTYYASILRFDAIHTNDLFRASYGSKPLKEMRLVIAAEELEKAAGFIQPEEPQADQSTGKIIDSRSSLLIANFKSSLAESHTAEKTGTVESDVAKGVIRHLDEKPNIPGLNRLLLLKGYLEKSKQAHDDQGQTKEANQAHHLLRRLRDMAGMNPFKGIVDVALDTATPLPNGAGWAFSSADNPEFNTAYEAWHKQTLLDFNQYLIGKITESSGDKQELYQEISDQLLEFFNDPYHGPEYKAHFHDQCQYFHDWLKHKHQSMDCDRQFDNSPLKTAVKITETEFKRRLLFQHPADFLAWYREEETKSSNQVHTPSKHSRSNPKFRKRKESDTETTPQSEIPQAQYLGVSGFEGFASGQSESRGLRYSDIQKSFASKPRKGRRKNKERATVQEFWDKWQTNKQLYENVTAFDIAMLDETGLDRLQTIQGWRLKLEKGTRLTG